MLNERHPDFARRCLFPTLALFVGVYGALDAGRSVAQQPASKIVRPANELLYSVDPSPPTLPSGFTWQLRVDADGTVDLGRHGRVRVAGLTFDEAKRTIDRQIGLDSGADSSKYAERLQRLRTPFAPTLTTSEECEVSKPAEAIPVVPASIVAEHIPQPSMLDRMMQPFKGHTTKAIAPRDSNVVRLSKGRAAPLPPPVHKPSTKGVQPPELIRVAAIDAPASAPAHVLSPPTMHLSKGRTVAAPGLTPAPPPAGSLAPHECATVSLPPYVIHPPDVLLIESTRSLRDQPIRGQHLVRPDGTISLGIYGSAYVSGMTLEQAKSIVAHEISKHVTDFDARDLAVDVLAYNSKVYYVITDGGGYGEQVYRLPITGHETVLDALAQINGLPPVASKSHIWVARACQASPCGQMILPVDWKGIACGGLPESNYQLFPGDRVYVKADKFITIDSYLAKLLSPIERLMGTTLLGATTYNSITGRGFGFQ